MPEPSIPRPRPRGRALHALELDPTLFEMRPLDEIATALDLPAALLWQGGLDGTLFVVRCARCVASTTDWPAECRACVHTCRWSVKDWMKRARGAPVEREWLDGAAFHRLQGLLTSQRGREEARQIMARYSLITEGPGPLAEYDVPRPLRLPHAGRRPRTGRDPSARLADREIARQAHALEGDVFLHARCAWEHVSRAPSPMGPQAYLVWSVQYGWNPWSCEPSPRPRSLVQFCERLQGLGVPVPQDRGLWRESARTFHAIAREVNRGAQLRLLVLLESDEPLAHVPVPDRPALAAYLRRKWAGDCTKAGVLHGEWGG